ncbi:2-oxoacid:acceptor oxidoreductase family protein [Heliophilum fasciatum]|uniref:Pyruvate ferredoxin oxidoreductase gamma subunit n=1 Tax=Heliophilum fasciatum TaxID=35700 RepID=A0A4R2RZZ7_9FIRM|nr:2-oxoacid:acceptor oxidoreductase family protein [Heliophilum fasciatum]MCW2276820.1 pyruvate ferredoxin oxidoreductase gamma subunit [Heliophilum fasciatum]TCP68719.1 pyruvate ferredoxin oxidoreductase gamma subunit [Heliophilum fasciatum]
MIEVRWLGRGGQGGFTASRLLGVAAVLFENKYAQAFPSFGPERRGAPVLGFTRIDDQKITLRSEIKQGDYLVVMDENLWSPRLWDDLKPNGLMLLNTSRPERFPDAAGDRRLVTIDALQIARETIGKPIVNTAMLGALVAVSGIISLEAAVQGVQKEMKPALAKGNVAAVTRAYERLSR